MYPLTLCRLANRKLLKITGPDCYAYLQGILSNDLRYMYEPDRIPIRRHVRQTPSVLSSFMLNPHGRIICDMLIYRTPRTRFECEFLPPGKATQHDELLIECDASRSTGLANTLMAYRVRRKIAVSLIETQVWCLFPKLSQSSSKADQKALALINPNTLLPMAEQDVVSDSLTIVPDPRLASLGLRILSDEVDFNRVKKSVQSIVNADIQEASIADYTLQKHALGVGEGFEDYLESQSLPLECNADWLGSVSFTKGCYLGQELTARIHFTGVVRKRLMPILLKSKKTNSTDAGLVNGSHIEDGGGKRVGTIRSVRKDRGLALIRHDLIQASPGSQHELLLQEAKVELTAYVPYWWSLEEADQNERSSSDTYSQTTTVSDKTINQTTSATATITTSHD